MTAFGYLFIDIEKKFRVPVADQQQVIEQYSQQLGLSVDQFFIEQNISARRPFGERDEGHRLLQVCQADDTIIVARADMVFSRAREGVRLIRRLKKQGISLHIAELEGDVVKPQERKLVISTGIADLVATLLERLAQRERSGQSAAIRHAKKIQQKQGRYLGGPVPFGWQVNGEGRLEEDRKEQLIIEEMMAMRADRWSYRDIARQMKEKHGVTFSHEGIRKILASNRTRREEMVRRAG
ncbi:recombinase family protein [Desulfolithobacter sp.]